MADASRDRLLASYADMGEAMVIQNLLEAEGIRCRIMDLDNVPAHLFGILGPISRSVGVWVAEPELERAVSLLSTLGAVETRIDEEALAAEALAAAPARASDGERRPLPAPERGRTRSAAEARAPWRGAATVAVLVAGAALLLARGCG
jgi:hypothetical protein